MKKSLKESFNQKSFDRIFIRQRDDVSCAAAAFATAARLCHLPAELDYKFFRKALKTTADGSDHARIVRTAQKYLPVVKAGMNTYHGGVAIGYIRQKPSGDDHAVVFLARRADTLIYYDPADHKIYRDKTSNMRRGSPQEKDSSTWTANLPPIPGAGFNFWKKLSEPNPFRLTEQIFWQQEHKKSRRHGR